MKPEPLLEFLIAHADMLFWGLLLVILLAAIAVVSSVQRTAEQSKKLTR
ncbi:hypothetical protein [Spirosoma sp.]|nr:hypothetical protein [Spirosoma sp.]MCX6216541.1 hypothetical protein [Spirosoma sp.]